MRSLPTGQAGTPLVGVFEFLTAELVSAVSAVGARGEVLGLVLDDDAATAVLGRRPLAHHAERALLLGHVRGVASVSVVSEQQLVEALAPLRPDARVLAENEDGTVGWMPAARIAHAAPGGDAGARVVGG